MKETNKYVRDFITILICFLFIVSFIPAVYAQSTEKPQPPKTFQYGKNPEIQQIKPKKPVKIKLKRSAKGEYSWDLSGDSADDVVKTDQRLRKMLNIE